VTRKFSIRPGLTFKGRAFKGLRGWAGKPLHPPLTDVPIGAYTLAAAFDVISRILRDNHKVTAVQFNRAALFCLYGGLAVSVLAALTGWADWHRSTPKNTQARRTTNTHAGMMIVGTLLVIADIVLHLVETKYKTSTIKQALLSSFMFIWVSVGATYGGGLVFEYGFNVETSGDHPVWHESEVDVLPGQH
jgi:uncharacterized membrane protein